MILDMAHISTAARRIVRNLNSRRPGFTLYFDINGRQVDEKYGPEGFGPAANSYYVEFPTGAAGRKLTWTQREVQDWLDAVAAALTVEPHPGIAREIGAELVSAWSDDDAAGRPRISVEAHRKLMQQVYTEIDAELADMMARPA
jgi:hypothetical protein